MKGPGYVIWLIALASLVAACQAAPVLKVGEIGEIPVGGSAEVPITLEGVENGLSGYNLTVTLSNPECAEISAVSYPAWASLHRGGEVPAGETWIEAVDVGGTAEGNRTNVDLGRITLKGVKRGPTDLVIAAVRVQDDTGTSYEISEVKTGLVVGSTPGTQAGNSGHSGSASGSSSSGPGAVATSPAPTLPEESTPAETTPAVSSPVPAAPEETAPAQGSAPFLAVLTIAALIFGSILREKKE
ncbi:hypothetical protein J2129_000237 [Methanofollis sp. W23]|uniref:hypothetical protein n=1 Tax=Methanofollis sp. W23 TaxID=2817849 RepID=UPI001AE1BE78|nr:hypothetical protein [Methanofollis sp. W23]MBP2144783.1 hypothetical protein [Methanofollis sp. W23]